MNTKIILAAVAATLTASVALADKVILKSGSSLTGTAGVFVDGQLSFDSDDLGAIQIPIAKIAYLEASNEHVVQYNDLSTSKEKLIVSEGSYATVGADGEPQKFDTANVKAIDPVPETWHGSVNLSGTVTRGNTVGEAASVTANVSRRWEKDRFVANAGYYYASSGDSKETKQKTENRFELDAQEDHFWTGDKFYTYINGKYEYDRLMSLKYRYRLGAGLGYQWLEDQDLFYLGLGKASFNQEVGMAYVFEKYDDLEKHDYGSFRYAHHFTFDITGVEGLAFAHNLEFMPQVDDWTYYLIDTDVGLTYAFRANWQLIAKIEWDYQSKVAKGVKHSDIRYILGLGYKW